MPHRISARDEADEPVSDEMAGANQIRLEPLTHQTSYTIRALQALQKNVVVYCVKGCG